MDTRPRGPLSESEMCALQDFSALISRELNARASADAASHNPLPPKAGHGGEEASILSAIVQSAEDAIISTDLDGVILTWNPGAERLYGYSAAEIRGRSIFLTIHPDHVEEMRDAIRKAQQGRPTLRRETVRIHKDGTRRSVSLSIAPIKDADGKPVGIAGIAHDITSLKLAEATQLEAEGQLKLAEEAAGLGTWDWSVPSSSITRSEQCCRILGLPASQTTMSYAQWLSIVHPEDLDRVRAYHENILRGIGRGEAEFRIIRPDGSVHWIVSKARMHSDAAGEAARVIGVNLDVTQLREVEQAHRESEERYSDLFRTMTQAVHYLDDKGLILSANPAADKLYGLSIEKMRGRHPTALRPATREDGTPISWDEHPLMVALRTGSEVRGFVHQVRNAQTGEPRWLSSDYIPRFRAGETKPFEVQAVCQDLTPHVEAAARLRASEERSRLLIEHGMEVVGVIDAAATILYVSPSVERVFGYPPDLLIGTNSMEYLHPEDRQAVRGSIQSILHSPPSVAAPLNIRLRHRDGEWRTVESTAANCFQVEGLRGIVVNLRDISERVRYEERLRIYQDQLRRLAASVESAREEERGRISREVHDEFGQMLSVLKLDLENLAARHRPRGAEARGKFDQRVAEMVRAIDLSLNTVRRIAAELRPAVFEDLGLAAALKWQLQEFESRTGIRCRRRGLRLDAGLAAGPALAVFRIFQEILTNVVRHAKATALKVAVHADGDWFTLRVSDNGKGFDPNSLSPSRSLGLLGMRERAGMLGGTIEWSRHRNGGTTVTLRLPRGAVGAPASDVVPTPASSP
jgi:PAS domain S-box-containing protein